MQTMISAWLGLSIPWIFACLVTFYLGTARLSCGCRSGHR